MSTRRPGRPGNRSWSGDPDEDFETDDWSGSSREGGSFFPPSRPLEVQGGIRARSRRGSFGERWWARRWVEVIEGFEVGGRLTRGRTYARSGQVVSVRIEQGRAVAQVQGSRAQPYAVVIALRPLTDTAWKAVSSELRRRPILTAMLAAGSLHEQVEQVFEAAGSPLFPTGFGELSTKCSCPDWSNPCKHVAAVFYLIAEELDRDGMLLLRLRGIEREQIAAIVRPRTSRGGASKRRPPARPKVPPPPPEPESFWAAPSLEALDPGDIVPPPDNASLVRRLGSFPLWRGSEPFGPAMEQHYAAASQAAVALAARLAEGAQPREEPT